MYKIRNIYVIHIIKFFLYNILFIFKRSIIIHPYRTKAHFKTVISIKVFSFVKK